MQFKATNQKESQMGIEELTARYVDAGFNQKDARAEAEREYRLTTGDPYAFRTEAELAEMRAVESDQLALARRTAGVCEEFPMGEFAVPGFNCDFEEDYR